MKRVKLVFTFFALILIVFPHFSWGQNWSWRNIFGTDNASPRVQREVYDFQGLEYDYSCGQGTGLSSTYYTDSRLRYEARRRFPEPVIDFYLVRESPAPGIDGNKFSLRWNGFVYAPETGTYTFSAVADDGMRIWMEDELVLDAWIEQVPTSYEFKVFMEEGKLYKLKVEYVQLQFDHAVAQLYWQLPSYGRRRIVQEKYLFPNAPEPCLEEEPQEELVASIEPIISPAPQPERKKKPIVKTKPVVEKQEPVITYSEKKPEVAAESYDELISERKIVLDDITFDQGSYEFKGDEATEKALQKLLNTMLKYDDLKIQIEGHTDNVGRYYANQRLSQNRADKVAFYLIDRGIEDDRIITKGFGSDIPVQTNQNEKGRSKNRRVEIIVLSE